jgi:superfamily II DNA or RNA helicase
MIPRPDTQGVALAAICEHFREHDRALVCAGTGWGKSLAAKWAMEAWAPSIALVCAPTIDLLGQLIRTWQCDDHFDRYFAMCCRNTHSDEESDQSIAVQHSTSPDALAAFLGGDDRRIVFSTYASVPALIQAFKIAGKSVDFAVFDEAHHLAGSEALRTGLLLDNEALLIRKRLSLTATPKHVVFDSDDEDAYSMDNTAQFGERVYDMPFRDAVEADVIVPFRVYVATAPVHTEIGRIPDAEKLTAMEVAIRKFQSETGARKLLSKHFTIAEARSFAERLNHGGTYAVHVSAETSAKDRTALFAEIKRSSDIVVTYSECLNEGIDFPDMDGICFMSAIGSTRVVVQATGRTVRKSPGKECGYVMIPAFTCDGDLARSAFRHVGGTLAALCEADRSLHDEIRLVVADGGNARADRCSGVLMNLPDLKLIGMAVLQSVDRAMSGLRKRYRSQTYNTVEEVRSAALGLGLTTPSLYEAGYRSDPRLPGEMMLKKAYGLTLVQLLAYQTCAEVIPALRAAGITAKNGRNFNASGRTKDGRIPPIPMIERMPDFPGWDAIFPRKRAIKYTVSETFDAMDRLGIQSSSEYAKRLHEDPKFSASNHILRAIAARRRNVSYTVADAQQSVIRLGIASGTEYVRRRGEDPKLPCMRKLRRMPGWPGADAFFNKG